ncbi:ABC transporter permease [Streptomyces sp. NBC_00878]|uniref:ABC transporter permease n=1 Tax=Streptomyces sp. NBC_00878 TaxID=2975854 RepID=UPI002256F0C6|nr:ABC transporter permease [Streptomyces sp. NBC_00878]MCX4903840.1 ABC transporter permease [Streptomyces sp. NBC_00878]
MTVFDKSEDLASGGEVDTDEEDRMPEPNTTVTVPDVASGGSRSRSLRGVLDAFAARYALLGVWLVMAAVYGGVMPGKFLGTSTAQAIFGSQSALLFLAVAALCTFVIGEFDLSSASSMGLSATIIPVLVTLHDVSLWLACVIALLAAVSCGLINAFFVVVVGVPSLICTLGTASLFLGIAELISSSTIVSVSSHGFSEFAEHNLLGLPLSFFYGLALCLGFAYVLSWTPIGRHITFVGANREVARLAGISVDRIRAGGYVVASLIAGMAGIILVATVGGFDPTASATYLLPALAAVFLSTAIVRPGQFNPIGTFFGVYFLETGILGLQLLGYSGWVQDAFYGVGLLLAVTVASLVRARAKTS